MSYIGIGSPIPDISSLPGQTGGEVEVTLDYPSASACGDASPFSPSEATPPGGVFAATPSGLNINTSTGEVTPVGSTAQAYTISYTVSGVTSQFALTINAVQQSTFSYASSSFEDSGTALPTLASGTTSGGTFVSSSPSDLTVNASTGELTLAGATVGGPYTITYTTPGPCATSSTFQISITATVRIIANNFAMEFDGQSYVSAGNPTQLQMTGDISVSAWFKTSNSGSQMHIAGRGANYSTSLSSWALFRRTNNGLAVQLRSGDAYQYAFSPATTFNDGNWHHAAFTREVSSGNLKLYINGSLIVTTTGVTAVLNNETKDTFIGADTVPNEYFTGDIDEVAIWNKAISDNAVQEIYNATTNNPGFTADLFKLANESQAPVYWNRMGDD